MSEHEAKKPAEVLRTKRLEIVDHEGAVGERGPKFQVVLFITALIAGGTGGTWIGNAEPVVFQRSGHFTPVEEPEAFFEAVRGGLHRC